MKLSKTSLIIVYLSIFCITNLKASSNFSYSFMEAFIEIDTLPQLNTNCPFLENDNSDGFISDDEYEVMNFCLNNRITDATELASNLLGTWELVGHGEGWIPTVSQPCVTIEVTATTFTIDYSSSFLDTVTTHAWEVLVNPNTNMPYLEFSPYAEFGQGFGIICSEYMFSDGTPADGNMYLYKKKSIETSASSIDEDDYMSFDVFPNPTSGMIQIKSKNSVGSFNIQLYNFLGQAVDFEYSYENDTSILLDLTKNNRGSYFLVINQDGQRFIQKIILM